MKSDVESAAEMLYRVNQVLSPMGNDDRMLVGEKLIAMLRTAKALQRHSVEHEEYMRQCELETKALSITIHASPDRKPRGYRPDDNLPF